MDGKYKNLPWALAKELSQAQNRPSWESSNEGIHERISFDDTIWGFNLAGGAYYETPLRVTQVKENSRADKAGIKVGDILRYINDVDTALLTLQQAHDMILESGIEIKLKLSAPDVDEPYHYTYEDEILEELREMKRKRDKELKKKRKPFTGAKTNSEWSCAWPCNKKRDVMYRESNCFLIPSKHEEKIRLIKEKQKLEEDRAEAQKNKEKIKSMMRTQNAYYTMDSDEEIEPQYLELLYKSKGVTEHHNDISKEKDYKPKAEFSKALTPDRNSKFRKYINVSQESRNQNTAADFKNHINKATLDNKEAIFCEDNDSHSDSNELFSDNIMLGEDEEVDLNNDFVNLTIFFDDNNIGDHNSINEDLSHGEDENVVSESEYENYVENNKKIVLQKGTTLKGQYETKFADEELSIPSDDDDMFLEELVILDESDINSDILTDEENEEPAIFHDLSQRDGFHENEKAQLSN